jgi:hypothetical protein
MGSPPGPMAVPTQPHNSWFARHWKSILSVGCLGLILLVAAFVGGIFLLVESSIKNSRAYTEAITRAQQSPLVLEKIGQPLKAGWFVSGSINVSGSSGNADFSIPLSGSKGKGKLYVVAKKSAGLWQFETLQVEVEGESQRIDLLQAEQKIPVEQ